MLRAPVRHAAAEKSDGRNALALARGRTKGIRAPSGHTLAGPPSAAAGLPGPAPVPDGLARPWPAAPAPLAPPSRITCRTHRDASRAFNWTREAYPLYNWRNTRRPTPGDAAVKSVTRSRHAALAGL